jgi:hypothetical protein
MVFEVVGWFLVVGRMVVFLIMSIAGALYTSQSLSRSQQPSRLPDEGPTPFQDLPFPFVE